MKRFLAYFISVALMVSFCVPLQAFAVTPLIANNALLAHQSEAPHTDGSDVSDSSVGGNTDSGSEESLTAEDAPLPGVDTVSPPVKDVVVVDAPQPAVSQTKNIDEPMVATKTERTLGQNDTNLAGLYVIESASDSSKTIDVQGASCDAGANVQLYTDNTSPAQRFSFVLQNDGYYTITNVNSDLVLDVQYGQGKNGSNVWQYVDNGSDAQKWQVVSAGNGLYSIVSKLGTNFVLDIQGGLIADGANIEIYESNGTDAQKFNIRKISRTIPDGSYTFSNQASGKVLDIAAASMENGANAQLWSNNGTAAQAFLASYDEGTGYYSLTNQHSLKTLDVADASVLPGANVQQWIFNGNSAQKWTITDSGDGSYVLRAGCSGLVLDAAWGGTTDGTNVQTFTYNGTAAQKWCLSEAAPLEAGMYTLASCLSDRHVLDIAAGSKVDGANLQLYTANNTWAQKFMIEPAGRGYYTITSVNSKKCLDVTNAGMSEGTNVAQFTANGTDAQLWKPIYGPYGYSFKSKCNGLFLDVSNGNAVDGANVQVWSGNNSPAQAFRLAATTKSVNLNEGAYTIESLSSPGSVLDIFQGSSDNGAALQLYESNGTYAQKFKVLNAGSNDYYMANIHSSKYIDVDTGGRTFLQQWDRNEAVDEKWRFIPTEESENEYYIESVFAGRYLSNESGALTLAVYTGAQNQKFRLSPTRSFKVYLDAGHGYNSNGDGNVDPGAGGCGFQEYNLTADLVNRTKQELENRGVEYYIGHGKAYWDRHADAVNMGCSTFLSIHFNAGGGSGTETYIHSQNAAAGSPVFQQILHPYLTMGVGLADRGMKQDQFAVCGGRLPSVLSEVAFIDSFADMTAYQLEKDRVARFIAAGIQDASKNPACAWN
ncbi:MAG: RICIN domain-containing protein [Raoultibacter sp.]